MMKKKSMLEFTSDKGYRVKPLDTQNMSFSLRSKKINWGILGCGLVAHDFASVLNKSPNANIYACASRSMSRSKKFSEKHFINKAFDDYGSLIKEKNIDIIYIATTPSLHFKHAMLAIKNKKNVLIEKPMAINFFEAKEIVEAAQKNNVFCMEGVWTNFFPAIEMAKNLADSGVIGAISSVHSDIGFNLEKENKSLKKDSRKNLDAALDVGIYAAHIATLFLGNNYIKINTSGRNLLGINKDACCHVFYKKNKMARLSWSYLELYPECTTIIGTKGNITINNPWHTPTKLTLMVEDHSNLNLKKRHNNFLQEEHTFPFPGEGKINFNFPGSQGFIYEIEAIHRCLHAGLKEAPQVPLKNSLASINMIDIALKNLRGDSSLELINVNESAFIKSELTAS